jgi:hypothetical protein
MMAVVVSIKKIVQGIGSACFVGDCFLDFTQFLWLQKYSLATLLYMLPGVSFGTPLLLRIQLREMQHHKHL